MKAFTLVELLVSIAIVGILASLAITNIGEFKDRAKQAATIAEMKNMMGTFLIAKQDGETNLGSITGNTWTGGACRGKLLYNDTSSCYTTLRTAMNKIYASINLEPGPQDNVLRDGWGSPYYLDENEGEPHRSVSGICVRDDVLASAGADGRLQTDDDIRYSILRGDYCQLGF